MVVPQQLVNLKNPLSTASSHKSCSYNFDIKVLEIDQQGDHLYNDSTISNGLYYYNTAQNTTFNV